MTRTVPQSLRSANVSVWLADYSVALQAADRPSELRRMRLADGVRLSPPVAATRRAGNAGGAQLARLGTGARQAAMIAYSALLLRDVRAAARRLLHSPERGPGEPRLVEFCCTPDVATNAAAIVAQAQQALHTTRASNVMIGLPAGGAGLAALQELTYRGMNTAVDEVFCAERYDAAAEAYIRGLERRLDDRRPPSGIASVAWLPVAPLDERIDALLDDDSPLRAAVAVAVAQQLYLHANRRFSGARWRQLAAHGAQPLRLGFSELAAGGPAGRALAYVERLALPDSLLALPSDMLEAPCDDARLAPVEPDETEVEWVLREAGAQIQLRAIASELQRRMQARKVHAFHSALHALADRLTPIDTARGELCV